MPTPVPVSAVPASEDGVRRAIGDAHRRDPRRVSFREGWRGPRWHDRFASDPMDAPSRLTAARYERTGRPLGSEPFTGAVERHLRRTLRRGKPGPQGSRAS